MSFLRLTVCVIVGMCASFSAAASTLRVDISAIGALTDIGLDGTANFIDASSSPYGSYDMRIPSNVGRMVYEPTSLCPVGGSCSPRYERSTFAEFDLQAVASHYNSATLVFTRFAGQANNPSGTAFTRLGTIGVSGYDGNGTLELDDFARTSEFLGATDPLPATENTVTYRIDVTDFIMGKAGGFAGIRFDMQGRSGAYITDNGYFIRNAPEDFVNTPIPYLELSTATPTVPLPAAGWMLIAALGGLGAMRARRKA